MYVNFNTKEKTMSLARRNAIHQLFQSKPFITLHELEEMFPEVSSMTLRRDIEYFERQGEAIKVRGGARSMKFIQTLPLKVRSQARRFGLSRREEAFS